MNPFPKILLSRNQMCYLYPHSPPRLQRGVSCSEFATHLRSPPRLQRGVSCPEFATHLRSPPRLQRGVSCPEFATHLAQFRLFFVLKYRYNKIINMLREYFPNTMEGASLYGGILQGKDLFCKLFEMRATPAETLEEINEFLVNNGYDSVLIDEFDESGVFYKHPVSIAQQDHSNHLLLWIDRDNTAVPQTEFLINVLKKFRAERDWDQFHNPKDLAIALSIEANELLEQFLWKKPEEANLLKVEAELADVFAYAFQLADRLNLNVEKILLQKVRHNADKYPVHKSKGTADKYTEL